MKEERFPHPGNLPHQPGGQPGQMRSFRGWRGECGSWPVAPQGRERPGQTVLATSLHFPARDGHMLVCAATGFSGQTQGEDLVWPLGDSPKGLECGHGREEVRLSLYVDFYILYIENHTKTIRTDKWFQEGSRIQD